MLSLSKIVAAVVGVFSTPPEVKMDLYDAAGPCVLGKKYFTHLRRWVADQYGWDVELSNHGGATLCWVVEQGNKPGMYYFFYTWAECSMKPDPETGRLDQFCRKTGRLECLANFQKFAKLHTEVRNTCPSVEDAREYVSEQFKICKERYYPQVWEEYV